MIRHFLSLCFLSFTLRVHFLYRPLFRRPTSADSIRFQMTPPVANIGWIQKTLDGSEDFERFRTTPNDSVRLRLRTTPNDSQRLRTTPDDSDPERLRTTPGDSGRFRTTPNNAGRIYLPESIPNLSERVGVDSGFMRTLPITNSHRSEKQSQLKMRIFGYVKAKSWNKFCYSVKSLSVFH